MIVLPEATNLLPPTLTALCGLPSSTQLVIVGNGPAKTPYGKPLNAVQTAAMDSKAMRLPDGDPETVLWPALRDELGRLNALPDVSLVDAGTGKPVWGVEWLSAKIGGRTVANIVDLLDRPVRVKLLHNGKSIRAKDLLSLGSAQKVEMLRPESPVLARITF